jgi:hypothetical protein
MTDYNDGNWHGWNGERKCPVHHESLVDQVWHDPDRDAAGLYVQKKAGSRAWGQTLRFRVVKPYREPREFWVNVYGADDLMAHPSKDKADRSATRLRRECIRVREVLDDN